MSLVTWDHTVLPATRHKWTHPALTPARQDGTQFTYPGGMTGYLLRWFTRPQTVTHPSSNLAQCWLTTLIEAKTLTTILHRHLTLVVTNASFLWSYSACFFAKMLYWLNEETNVWLPSVSVVSITRISNDFCTLWCLFYGFFLRGFWSFYFFIHPHLF